jgi:hypothetical protein
MRICPKCDEPSCAIYYTAYSNYEWICGNCYRYFKEDKEMTEENKEELKNVHCQVPGEIDIDIHYGMAHFYNNSGELLFTMSPAQLSQLKGEVEKAFKE